jgi:putative flippase GtrA
MTLGEKLRSVRSSSIVGQLIRFGIAGGISTVIYLAVYLPMSIYVFSRSNAVYAVPFAFAAAVTVGYFLHSRWSFKGHSSGQAGAATQIKFISVQASGMALNSIMTWIGTALLGYPAWAPLLPAVALATICTFVLNRWLVFV